MRLVKVQVTNFRCVDDSTEFKIGDVTCLVGKNESGKTTILQALERLNPALSVERKYDKLRDYPRRHWADYDTRHAGMEAEVLNTKWELEEKDVTALEQFFGPGCLTSNTVTISKYYESDKSNWVVPLDETTAARNLSIEAGTDEQFTKIDDLRTALAGLEARSELQDRVLKRIDGFRHKRAHLQAIDALHPRWPKFLYFSNYSRMSGDISVDQLMKDQQEGKVREGARLFVQFLEYAGTTLEELRDATKFEELRAPIEATSNIITDRVFEYWSQNQYLTIEVTVDTGRSGDPPPFNQGTVVRARVRNDLHKVTVPFSDRSAGFVWFFSFLVAFAQVSKKFGNVIILLDEPGHGLHGKAQGDLLRFIEEKLRPGHQVIYTTHSPFMVPAENLSAVRLVEDRIELKEGSPRPIVHGTKVSDDFLSNDADTIFPLQAALGYEITQTLFVGKNTLLVEGPSDILYLQALSAALKKRGRPGLDRRWVISPSGGVDKIWPFVSLFAGKHLNTVVLTDFAQGIKKNIERLKVSKLLANGRIMTATDFVAKPEADTEDLLETELWCSIVNRTYSLTGAQSLTADKFTDADGKPLRALAVTEAHFRLLPPGAPAFDHFAPRRLAH
jgi:energy-coupling factor transporter ATP-binding protein EcfA2